MSKTWFIPPIFVPILIAAALAGMLVVRGNARLVALAGEKLQAKFRIRVLGIIQWCQIGQETKGSPPLAPTPTPTHG